MLPPIKILDFTRLLPGPLATLHLADLGAEVVKVEDTQQGDYARTLPPYLKTMSPLYVLLNRNKKSLAIDYRSEKGKNIIYELVKNTDILIESFRPGAMEAWGLGYEFLQKINPKLVFISVTGFGQVGEWANKAGHDLNFLGYSGILHHLIQKEVTIPPIQIADVMGGAMTTVIAALAGYIHQLKYQKGQWIDVSMLDGVVSNSHMMLNSFLAMKQELPPGTDLLTGGMPFYDVYPTKDNRFFAVAALEFKFWKIFCETINRIDWISKHYVFGEDAKKLRQEITYEFSQKTFSEWSEIFAQKDCCVTPILNYTEVLNHRYFSNRKTVLETTHPTEGHHKTLGSLFKSKEYDFHISRQAPAHGENTKEILLNLGYSIEEIEKLNQEKLIKL